MYCTQQDIEQRIGTAQLRQLTNDTLGITPPVLTGTPASGGNLTGTMYYVVTGLNDKGETVKSNEVTFTADNTNKKVVLAWAAIATATSYKIYKSSVSGTYTSPSLLIHQVAVTYTDDGTVTSLLVGAPPIDAGLPDSTILSAIIEKSDREIDGKAGQVWTTPFIPSTNCVSIPSQIKQISVDYSVYYCFLRRFSSMDVPKQWVEAYKYACQKLDDISNMLIELDGTPTVRSAEADIITPTTDPEMDFYNPDSPLSRF